ncbi:MAG: hypothetical protein KDA73_00925 [Rhodobacteraceae bacterium]|nr:hypothetical protein [Paracoccaceae bacterium]
MSIWLSEYNKLANAAKGQVMAEASRQQNAAMKAWSDQMTETWMAFWFPWLNMAQPKKRR